MKKLLSVLLAVLLTFGAALTCAAQDGVGFAVNAERLSWILADENGRDVCTLFIVQSSTLHTMQPHAQFTVYTAPQGDDDLPEVLQSGDAAQWTRGTFTDADGVEHVFWMLPQVPDTAHYLRFELGAFTDAAGDPAPEMCASYRDCVRAYDHYESAALAKLQTVKTDAQLTEGEPISFPQYLGLVPASYFSVLAETDDGETTTFSVEYDELNDLTFPAKAGYVRYTLLFCGQPIGQTETIHALSHEEYAALYKKDRPLSVLKGIALIPCLPAYMLVESALFACTVVIMSFAFTPTIVLLPFTTLAGSGYGLAAGAVTWWQAITSLIGGIK